MRKDRISVIYKEPGQQPYVREMDNTLEAFQGLVLGYIEHFPIGSDWGIVINEEGKLNGMKYNFTACGEPIFGPAIFVGVDRDEFTDFPSSWEDFQLAFPFLFKTKQDPTGGADVIRYNNE